MFALVFIITGSQVVKADFERLITLGVDGYFRKPIDMQLLQTIVGMTLTKSSKIGKKHASIIQRNYGFHLETSTLDKLLAKMKRINNRHEEFQNSLQEDK